MENGELPGDGEVEKKDEVKGKDDLEGKENGTKKKSKKEKKKKKKKENGKNKEEIISEMRDSPCNSDSEENDFWMPPVGERWDFDDGRDRWGSDSESGDHHDEDDRAGILHLLLITFHVETTINFGCFWMYLSIYVLQFRHNWLY